MYFKLINLEITLTFSPPITKEQVKQNSLLLTQCVKHQIEAGFQLDKNHPVSRTERAIRDRMYAHGYHGVLTETNDCKFIPQAEFDALTPEYPSRTWLGSIGWFRWIIEQ